MSQPADSFQNNKLSHIVDNPEMDVVCHAGFGFALVRGEEIFFTADHRLLDNTSS